MVGYCNSTSSATHGSSVPQQNGFHLSRKPYFSFNGSNFKAQNPRGSNPPRSLQTNLEKDLDNDVKFHMIVRRIGAGLENLGNTCFLNSVLQCLTHTEPLVAYLLSGKHQKSCHVVGFCALCAIQNHVSRALQSTGRILAPKDLVSNLRRISRNFRTARQEDAHEYMVHLLESMHKCCLPSGVPYESPSAHEKSLVHKIFGGCLRSQVKCTQCSYCSNKFDPFLDLSLEIVKADSLHKALNHFTAAEQLDGGERQYMCQQCKQKVRALKQLTIDKAPFVLTIHLKRFGSHISGQKIDKKVQFGPILNLKPYVSGSHEGELKYTLYGVLVHAGWSTHSGHYYCFVRTSSGIWYSLDDNRVRQVSERTVLEQKAYMLFYVRDGMNFGAGNIASAIQSQKMVPTTMPNRPSCTSTAGHRYMSIDKPVNAAQKEKAVAATVENGLSSTSATCQGFQNKVDGDSAHGDAKEKILATALQKRSGENDSEGRLHNSLPAKKFKSTDDSDALVRQNLPNVHSLEKNLPKEDSLLKPESKDLSQSSIESKENDSVLKANMQHLTNGRIGIGGVPKNKDLSQSSTEIKENNSVVKENVQHSTNLRKSIDGVPKSKDLSQSSTESKENDPVLKANMQHSTNGGKCIGGVPKSEDLSQSSTESKENELKANMQRSTNLRKCNGGEPSAVNVVEKIFEHVTTDDKSLKTDLLVSLAKAPELLVRADTVVDMVRKTCNKGGAPEQTVARESVENNCPPIGAVISVDGLLSNAPSHLSNQKPKKKPGKYRFPSMHLGTRILYGESLSLQKRKKHNKVKRRKQKLDAKTLMDEKLGPSTSHATAAIEFPSKISRKRSHFGSKKSSDHVKLDGISAHKDLVSEVKRRTASGNSFRAGDDPLLKNGEMQQQDGQTSHLKNSTSTCNGVADKVTRNPKRTDVEQCNGVEWPSSQIVEVHNTAGFSIGYVADEWDEEYDRGKRKKLRISKNTFGEPNPFQKFATKAAKLKGKHKQYNLANQPFRI